jgi:hypothetical protein
MRYCRSKAIVARLPSKCAVTALQTPRRRETLAVKPTPH